MPEETRKIIYYKQTRPEAKLRRRGIIDLPSAALLIRQYPWTGRKRRDDGNAEPASSGLIGFVDEDDNSIEFAADHDGWFYLQFDHKITRKFMRTVPRTIWLRRTARTRSTRDLLHLTKLFFHGRRAVIDDIFTAAANLDEAAEHNEPAAADHEHARPAKSSRPESHLAAR